MTGPCIHNTIIALACAISHSLPWMANCKSLQIMTDSNWLSASRQLKFLFSSEHSLKIINYRESKRKMKPWKLYLLTLNVFWQCLQIQLVVKRSGSLRSTGCCVKVISCLISLWSGWMVLTGVLQMFLHWTGGKQYKTRKERCNDMMDKYNAQ